MLAKGGETGEPCGVPASVSETTPPLEHPRSKPRPQQLNHLPVNNPAFDLGYESLVVDLGKAALDIGVEHPQRPRLAATRTTSRAWWVDRFGRNPKLDGAKSASNTGSRTILAAAITTRSATRR